MDPKVGSAWPEFFSTCQKLRLEMMAGTGSEGSAYQLLFNLAPTHSGPELFFS